MKNILLNRTFLLIVIGILVLLNIFCFVITRANPSIECPIYILYTNNEDPVATKNAETIYNTIQNYTDIQGDKSFLLLTPESPKYDKLVKAYNLSNKTNAFIAISEKGKVLSYKYPIPSEAEVKKIMSAISHK